LCYNTQIRVRFRRSLEEARPIKHSNGPTRVLKGPIAFCARIKRQCVSFIKLLRRRILTHRHTRYFFRKLEKFSRAGTAWTLFSEN